MKTWPLQEAKAKLSELVKRVEKEGAQEITVRGEPKVVIMPKDDYLKLAGKNKPKLSQFLRRSPLAGIGLSIKRDRSRTRKVEL